jgi:YD repeat-containing protein
MPYGGGWLSGLVTDAKRNTTTFTYTAQIQGAFTFYTLTTVTFADGTSPGFTYDALGSVLTATDQAGLVTFYTYNSGVTSAHSYQSRGRRNYRTKWKAVPPSIASAARS